VLNGLQTGVPRILLRVAPTRDEYAAAAARARPRLIPTLGPLPTPCLLWPGATTGVGYGQIRVGRRIVAVHVVLYRASGRPLRRGQLVHHRCETRLCANPEHLEAVTHRQHGRLHRRGLAPCGHPYDMLVGRTRRRACRRCRNAYKRRVYHAQRAA
jgi:hypothetical protein